MTRDDIYDHLAQVYIGKRKADDVKKKRQFNVWLFINIGITFIIFASAFYGMTAFLTQQGDGLQSQVFYSLHTGPVRMEYNFKHPYPPVQSFALSLDEVDVNKYAKLEFTIRAKEEGSPDILKIVFTNARNEESYQYVQGIDGKWKDVSITFDDFREITDWTTVKDVSFVLESWNVNKPKGIILIDEVRLSS